MKHLLTCRRLLAGIALVALSGGCQPAGDRQAGGERTSPGDVAAGGYGTDVQPPRAEQGLGTGTHGEPLEPLNSPQLWNELNGISFEQRGEFNRRLRAALRNFDFHLKEISSFGLEVGLPNGEPGLPPGPREARERLEQELQTLSRTSQTDWEATKVRMRDAWMALEREYQQRKPKGPNPTAGRDR